MLANEETHALDIDILKQRGWGPRKTTGNDRGKKVGSVKTKKKGMLSRQQRSDERGWTPVLQEKKFSNRKKGTET